MADTILITGGTGSMGRRLVKNLLEKGFAVRLLALPGDPGANPAAELGAEVVTGDVADAVSLRGLCRGVNTVYHLAAVILAPGREEIFTRVNFMGTQNLVAEAQSAGVRHFVHVSSISVTYPHPNAYSLSKRAAEEIVRRSGLSWTIIRPTLAYEDNGAAEFMHYVNFLRRFPVIPLIGGGGALKSPVHVEDIIRGLTAIAGNEKTTGQCYNFSGGSALSLRRMSELLLAHMGCKKPMLSVPVAVCRFAAFCLGLLTPWLVREPLLTWQTVSGVTQNAAPDHAPAQRDLGYSPRSFEEGLATLVSLKNTFLSVRSPNNHREGGIPCADC